MADIPNTHNSITMSEPPSTTSGPPPRKRRRPALSCEQCRKRKIKCDRLYPCDHCIQSKTICNYSSDNAVAHALEVASTTETGITFPSRPKKNPSSITSSSHQSSDTTSPKAITLSEGLISSHQSPNTDTDFDDSTSREALLKRIQSLEQKLIRHEREGQDEENVHNNFNNVKNLFFGGISNTEILPDTFEGKNLRGTVSKTRFFGQSHWMYSYGAFDRIAYMTIDPEKNVPDFSAAVNTHEVKSLLEQCKSIARAAKAQPHKQWLLNPNFKSSIPSREMSDKLVGLYFRTSESIFRILHIPSFQREYIQYWENPSTASTVFIMKFILVMSIGACFYQGSDAEKWHNQALQWIYAAQAWLSTPFEKGRLHISGVQIYCLVLLARLDNAVAGDLVWISAGALLRITFQMGFHRDPKYLPPMSQLHSELRRRLWATIVELNIQSSLDSGMPPLLSEEDSDTLPPSNIDDVDLDENTRAFAISKPAEIFTQASLQIMLGKTSHARLEIIRHANSVRCDPSYDEALALGTSLTKALKENNAFISRVNASTSSPRPVSQLQRNLLDLSVRRFLLSVHRPFAARAPKDPRYYFSRKVCLDCSMTILSYPSSDSGDLVASPGYRDDYTWIKTMSGGFQKGFIVHAATVVFTELLTLIDEDDGNSTTASQLTRNPLKQALRDIIELAGERIKLVENNVKGHLFISIILAQVEAMECGESIETAFLNAAKTSLRICLDHLKGRIRKGLSDEEYATIVDGISHSMNASEKNKRDSKGENNFTGDSNKGLNATNHGMNMAPANGNVFTFGLGMGVLGEQEWGTDFGMQDWNSNGAGVDIDFTMPDSWVLTGWEDGNMF